EARQSSVMAPDAIAPDGSDIYFLVTDARLASLVEVRLAPGRASKPVRHRTVEEIWYFLAGEGRVWRRPPAGAPQGPAVRPRAARPAPANARDRRGTSAAGPRAAPPARPSPGPPPGTPAPGSRAWCRSPVRTRSGPGSPGTSGPARRPSSAPRQACPSTRPR